MRTVVKLRLKDEKTQVRITHSDRGTRVGDSGWVAGGKKSEVDAAMEKSKPKPTQ